MEDPSAMPSPPAEHYRHHVARVRRLASEATTPAVREHLLDVAARYERLAEQVDAAMLRAPETDGGAATNDPHRQED